MICRCAVSQLPYFEPYKVADASGGVHVTGSINHTDCSFACVLPKNVTTKPKLNPCNHLCDFDQ